MQSGEETPLGIILCAEGSKEQIELLQLENTGVKVAEYLTELPDIKMLKQKLHSTIERNKKRLESHTEPYVSNYMNKVWHWWVGFSFKSHLFTMRKLHSEKLSGLF